MTKSYVFLGAIFAAGLGAMASAQTDPNLQSLSANALAAITGVQAPSTETPEVPFDELVKQAMAEGQSDDYLNSLLDEAIESGEVVVSDAMMTTEGDVDRATLLSSIVAQSNATATDDTAALAAEANGNTTAPAVLTAERFHTVVSGDSLAAIALTYYGDASQYTRIFDANRDKITRANVILVGQQLLIP